MPQEHIMTAANVSTNQRSTPATGQQAGDTPGTPVPPTVRRIVRHCDPTQASDGDTQRGKGRAGDRIAPMPGEAARRRVRFGMGV
jgi:hypothetical protein